MVHRGSRSPFSRIHQSLVQLLTPSNRLNSVPEANTLVAPDYANTFIGHVPFRMALFRPSLISTVHPARELEGMSEISARVTAQLPADDSSSGTSVDCRLFAADSNSSSLSSSSSLLNYEFFGLSEENVFSESSAYVRADGPRRVGGDADMPPPYPYPEAPPPSYEEAMGSGNLRVSRPTAALNEVDLTGALSYRQCSVDPDTVSASEGPSGQIDKERRGHLETLNRNSAAQQDIPAFWSPWPRFHHESTCTPSSNERPGSLAAVSGCVASPSLDSSLVPPWLGYMISKATKSKGFSKKGGLLSWDTLY